MSEMPRWMDESGSAGRDAGLSGRYSLGMERRNVEIVQAAIDAFNRGDRDAMLENVSPKAEFDLSRSVGLEPRVLGFDETISFFDLLGENWESMSAEPHEFLERGNDVAVPLTIHARGRYGIDVEARITCVWTIRDAAITRFCMYQSRQDALDAIGVSE